MSSAVAGPRRLVLCCDGTWNSADAGDAATNVLRLARIVKPLSDDGVSQVVYYDSGVGTGGVIDRVSGGSVGIGLSRNVREAYSFLVNNYRAGDEIFLIGFSRGAYTARCVAGLIGRIGLLRKRQMGAFAEAWDWNRRPKEDRDASQAAFDARFPERRTDVAVRCIAVWDTVGALGIPASRLTGNWQPCSESHRFLDATLGPRVEYAFQALALDERRQPFLPSIWSPHPAPAVAQVVRQVWFRGVHSDVGGGYAAHGAADIALLWMAEQLRPLLDLDAEGLVHELHETDIGTASALHDSFGMTWRLMGGVWRDWRTPTTPTPVTQFVHQTALDWPRRADGQFNQDIDLAGLPVWVPAGFEVSHARTRSHRTMGNATLPLARQGLCDRVVKALGGG